MDTDATDKHLTAGLHRDWLVKAFDDMDSSGKTLLELAPHITPAPSESDLELYSCSKEKLLYRGHLLNLERLIKSAPSLPTGVTISTVTSNVETVSTSSPSYLKLKKLEVRQFSGQRREYAAWKRDFCDVVIVPERPAAEIGLTLKSCVPEKFLYLFDNMLK